MTPHPDFAENAPPTEAALPDFDLTPLTPAELDEDYEAVMSSAEVLGDFFGSWPNGLTREENALDLAWHAVEFSLRRSFSWIIRSKSGAYLGCAYLFPAPGARGSAEFAVWLRDMPHREDMAHTCLPQLETWLGGVLPKGLAVTKNYSPDVTPTV